MTIRRLPIVVLGLSLAVLATADIARAQTPIPKSSVPSSPQFAATTLHVKGTVEIGSCQGGSINGLALKVTEYWYAAPSASSKDLVIPAQGSTADKLFFNGNQLVQGRVLGTTTLTGVGEFDVQWSEVASAGRKPWAVSVQNQRTGATVTAYRLLRLEVTAAPHIAGFLKAPPVIQFFGSETTKDVGLVTMDCILME